VLGAKGENGLTWGLLPVGIAFIAWSDVDLSLNLLLQQVKSLVLVTLVSGEVLGVKLDEYNAVPFISLRFDMKPSKDASVCILVVVSTTLPIASV
tara:strand:- start:842 stop:1126 length:285 start_codon:yes stop_codon:yes gene_type:complete